MRKCERCKKEIATVHLTEIKSGTRREQHLCERCARELKVPHSPSISVNELVNELLSKSKGSVRQARGEAGLRCPECGMTFAEFKKKGRFGCPNDYVVFRKHLDPLLEKIHGSTQYIGKVPASADAEPVNLRELITLRRRLKDVIKTEKYEEAARIRDRINELERSISGLEPEDREEGEPL